VTLRLLWIYGPPGVGKSSTAWEVLNLLNQRGDLTGYVDIDQLKMLYPRPANDLGVELLGVTSLSAIAAEFERTGATTLVVSGVLDPTFPPVYGRLARFARVFIRLTVDDAELKRRMDARGVHAEPWPAVLKEARAYARAPKEHPVVVAARSAPSEVAQHLVDAAASCQVGEPISTAAADGLNDRPTRRGGKALVVGGTRAVGKSSVAWQAFMAARRKGIASSFLDLRQLGFVGRDGGTVDHRLQAATLQAVWPIFRAAGAELLVLNGPVGSPEDLRRYRAALGDTDVTYVRLTAAEEALLQRVHARARGESAARLAGDDLAGLSEPDAAAVAHDAWRSQVHDDRAFRDPGYDTTSIAPEDAGPALLSRVQD
jgi:Mrp family chromosome partitioning ATPase